MRLKQRAKDASHDARHKANHRVQHKRADWRLAAIRQLEHIHREQAANNLLRLRANGLRLSGERAERLIMKPSLG